MDWGGRDRGEGLVVSFMIIVFKVFSLFKNVFFDLFWCVLFVCFVSCWFVFIFDLHIELQVVSFNFIR